MNIYKSFVFQELIQVEHENIQFENKYNKQTASQSRRPWVGIGCFLRLA